MAGPRAPRAIRPARRLAAGLLAVSAVLGIARPAEAASLDELRLALHVAEAELHAAQAAKRTAVDGLADAHAALQRARAQVNASAAAMWMGIEPAGGADPAVIDGLAAGVAQARADIGVAEVDIARAQRYFREVRAIVEAEEARAAASQRQQRDAQQQQQQQTSTIACPVAGPSAIYADFGAPRPGGPHAGIDLPAPLGTPAVAAWYARVVETPTGGWIGRGVILEDGAGNRWLYAHLSSVTVAVGDIVQRGQVIGGVGSTGNSTGPHLHFEIHARGVAPIDPYPLVSPACGIADPLGSQGRVAQETSTPEAGSR